MNMLISCILTVVLSSNPTFDNDVSLVHIIVRNILECMGKHSFSYEWKRMCMLWKHYVFFTLFTLVKNLPYEYKSMVFTILRGCLPYSNANARIVLMVHTMVHIYILNIFRWVLTLNIFSWTIYNSYYRWW